MNDRPPTAEVTDVLIRRWTIDQFQQGRRAPIEDREEQPEAERIGELPDRTAEVPRRLSPDLAERPFLPELRRPDRRIDVSRVRALGIVKIFRQPSLSGGVPARDHAGNHRNWELLEDRQVVRRPAHDLSDDADDQSGGGNHQARVRREIGGHFDPLAARPDADPRRAAVRRHQHHRNRKDVRQQQR